jgi:hypothetical protein
MKPLRGITTLALVTILSVWSCKKDVGEDDRGGGHSSPMKSSLCYHNIPKICGMFKFDSWQQYQELYDCLELEYEAYVDSFAGANGSLDDDQFNDLADSIGFIDEQTLINFENFQSFISYRSVMASAEEAWLAAGADPGLNPDNDNVLDDEIEETIRTESGALWVNDTIYCTDGHGDSWVIPGGNCAALDSILAGQGNNTYKVVYDGGNVLCKNHQVDHAHHYYQDSTKFIAYKLRWTWGGKHTKTISKMKMYRKKAVWRRNRTKIFVKCDGVFDKHNGDKCDRYNYYAAQKGWKRRRTLKAKYQWSGEYTFESGDAKGQYEFQDWTSPLNYELTY